MRRINFSKSDTDNIIKLYTVDKLSSNKIGKLFGCSGNVIARLLNANGISLSDAKIKQFDDATQEAIIEAYESGIGANGIHKHLGLDCSDSPVIRFLKSKYGTLRNRSEQQFARMKRSTPEQIAKLTEAAHDAVRGRKATIEEREKRAKTIEGQFNGLSKFEPIVHDFLVKNGFDCIPSKAVGVYNIDIFVNDSVAVEVFGGGWSYSDKTRIDRYIERTKYLLERGINTVFVIITKGNFVHGDNLIKAIDFASSNPPSSGKHWMVWGDCDLSIVCRDNIDHDSFVCPFINVRDSTTGRYVSVPK